MKPCTCTDWTWGGQGIATLRARDASVTGLIRPHVLLWHRTPTIGGYPGSWGISAILQRRGHEPGQRPGNTRSRDLPPRRNGFRRVAPCYSRPTPRGQRTADISLRPAEEGAWRPGPGRDTPASGPYHLSGTALAVLHQTATSRVGVGDVALPPPGSVDRIHLPLDVRLLAIAYVMPRCVKPVAP